MLGRLKKSTTNLIFGIRGLFTSSESKVYVEDLRKVVTHNVINDKSGENSDGRKCQYPKNYDDIVERGIIQTAKDSTENLIPGKYELLYGDTDKKETKQSFRLTLIKDIYDKPYENGNKRYFTIEHLVSQKRHHDRDYSRHYKPFGFSKKDLEKCVPVFEVENINTDKNPVYKLTNSSVPTKKVTGKNGEVQEVIDDKGRNDNLLYTSYNKPLSINFFEIRDHKNNRELDKSLVSVPIVLTTGLAKVLANFVTSPFTKMGEYLIGKKNPIAKAIGYVFFTPAAAIKNLVNTGAVLLRAPILLFVANKEKYGDAYYTMWKYQLKECWNEMKSDRDLLKNGTRSKVEEGSCSERQEMGTWNELDVRKLEIKAELNTEKAEVKGDSNVKKSETEKQKTTSTEILLSNNDVATESRVEAENRRRESNASTRFR